MAGPPRLTAEERRDRLVDAGATLFASRAYDEVRMEHVAAEAGVSRALLYRHFPAKRDLFEAVYARAATQLLALAEIDRDRPLAEQVVAGLDAHLTWFEQNRTTVLAANRTLAGDPSIQAIITDELGVLRDRILDATAPPAEHRAAASSVLMAWLSFVRTLSVEWLATGSMTRSEVQAVCLTTLQAALAPPETGEAVRPSAGRRRSGSRSPARARPRRSG